MKLFMAIVAVLSVPALAFAGASFTLTGSVGSLSGVSEIPITDLIAAGGAMSVNLGISTVEDCAGFDVALRADSDDAVAMTGRTINLAYTTYFNASKGDKVLFTTYKLLKTTATGEQNLGGTYSLPGYAWTPAQMATFQDVNLQVDTAMVQAAGLPYAIAISPAGITGLTILNSGQDIRNIYDPQIPLAQVLITPEPASMLLLLGAVPFLRRRR